MGRSGLPKEEAQRLAKLAHEKRRQNRLNKLNKSGDSALQDAEAAQNTVQSESHHMEPKEMREALPDQLQAAVEEKKAQGAPAEATAAAEMSLKLVLRALEMMEKRVAGIEVGQKSVLVSKETFLTCSTCGQTVKSTLTGRGVCNGDHVFVTVAPQDMSLWESFQGYVWNGVRYAGRQMLPRAIASSVMAAVYRWESREKKKFLPGGKVFGDIAMERAGFMRTPII